MSFTFTGNKASKAGSPAGVYKNTRFSSGTRIHRMESKGLVFCYPCVDRILHVRQRRDISAVLPLCRRSKVEGHLSVEHPYTVSGKTRSLAISRLPPLLLLSHSNTTPRFKRHSIQFTHRFATSDTPINLSATQLSASSFPPSLHYPTNETHRFNNPNMILILLCSPAWPVSGITAGKSSSPAGIWKGVSSVVGVSLGMLRLYECVEI